MLQRNLRDEDPREHETGLFKLFAVILKRKWLILASMAVVFSLTASLYTLHTIFFVHEAWVAECAIAPVDTNAMVLKNALGNPRLSYTVIEKNELLPALQFAFSDKREAISASGQDLSALKVAPLLQKSMYFKISDTQDLLWISLALPDPEMAVRILNIYLEELPVFLDQELLRVGAKDRVSLDELKKALSRMEQTNDVSQKKDIVHKLTAYLAREAGLERTNWIYFDVLEKPSLRQKQGRSLQQAYTNLVPLWTFLSAVIALFLAFFMDARDNRRRDAQGQATGSDAADAPMRP